MCMTSAEWLVRFYLAGFFVAVVSCITLVRHDIATFSPKIAFTWHKVNRLSLNQIFEHAPVKSESFFCQTPLLTAVNNYLNQNKN